MNANKIIIIVILALKTMSLYSQSDNYSYDTLRFSNDSILVLRNEKFKNNNRQYDISKYINSTNKNSNRIINNMNNSIDNSINNTHDTMCNCENDPLQLIENSSFEEYTQCPLICDNSMQNSFGWIPIYAGSRGELFINSPACSNYLTHCISPPGSPLTGNSHLGFWIYLNPNDLTWNEGTQTVLFQNMPMSVPHKLKFYFRSIYSAANSLGVRGVIGVYGLKAGVMPSSFTPSSSSYYHPVQFYGEENIRKLASRPITEGIGSDYIYYESEVICDDFDIGSIIITADFDYQPEGNWAGATYMAIDCITLSQNDTCPIIQDSTFACDSINISKEELVSINESCVDIPNGNITVNYTNLLQNYLPTICSGNVSYILTKDMLYNKTWDENCIDPNFHIKKYSLDSVFSLLAYGDYKLEVVCEKHDTSFYFSNKISNGSFENNFASWQSEYFNTTIEPYDGNITCASLPNYRIDDQIDDNYICDNIWCDNQATDRNEMLVIDGPCISTDTLDYFLHKNVHVLPNTLYKFSFKGLNVLESNIINNSICLNLNSNNYIDPKIKIKLNNKIYYIDLPVDNCNWKNVEIYWNSGTANVLDIKLFTVTYGQDGNDFAIDKIALNKARIRSYPVTCPFSQILSLDPKKFSIVDDLYFICPKDTLPIYVDSSLFTHINSWSYCCEEHLGELDPSKKIDIKPDNFSHYYTGGTFGGYFYVEAQTYQGCLAKDTGFIVDFNPPGLVLKEIDSVLNVSASKFRSIWKPIYSSIQWSSIDELMAFKNKLPFNNGMFGMYRPRQVFDYIDNRIQSKTNLNVTDVKLKMDGTFNDFKMFNWYHARFAECAPEWKLNHTITNYNPGSFEVENKDILNIYSTALYGYGGKLETAVAANASYEEIGYENFEEYNSTNFSTINQLNNTTGNIDIMSKIVGLKYPYMLEYNIEAAFGKYALVKNIEGNLCCDIPLKTFFQGRTLEVNLASKSQEVSMRATALVNKTTCDDKDPDLRLVTFQTMDKAKPYPFSNGPFCDRFWTGTLLVEKEIPVAEQLFPKISLSTSIAHSGKNSILIDTGFTSIPQYDLHLKAGINYVVSAWIHVDNSYTNLSPEELETFNNSNRIGVSLKVGNLSTMLYPNGEVIEGWQRLEGVVHVVDKDKIPSIEFMNTEKLYLDDIRIYPENGSIQTYVYDPSNYRLKAVLDQNNYATFYQYDDEGNLFSIKKETVKGIKTIQATQNYIKIK